MAIVYPEVHSDMVENLGERLFFEKVQQLNDQYHIFWSHNFFVENDLQNPYREADFVIVHPTRGFIVVEVKGGEEIEYDGRDQKWYRGGSIGTYLMLPFELFGSRRYVPVLPRASSKGREE
jgi:hypothetical protein